MVLKLLVFLIVCVSVSAQTTSLKPAQILPDTVLSGEYMATITNVVGWRLRAVLHISAYPGMPINVYYDLPDNGKINMAFTNAALNDSNIVLSNEAEAVRFEGVVHRSSRTIEGQWISARVNSNVLFNKLQSNIKSIVPEPQPLIAQQPLYPVALRLANRQLGQTIQASIITPDTSNAYPLLVIMGNGALQGTDEVLARTGGYAVARYTVSPNTSITDESALVSQLISHCIERAITDAGLVVLVAHNQKGALASLVCNELPETMRAVVCLNTPAKKGADYLPVQIEYMEQRNGTPDPVSETMHDMVAAWLRIVQIQPDTVISTAMILENVDSTVSSRPDLEEGRPDLRPLLSSGKISYVQSTLIPWLKSYINYQPELLLRGFPVPTLVILGDASEQLPIQYQAEAWKKIADINRRVHVEQFAQINFNMQRCVQCTPQEELLNVLPVDESVVERILEWAR